MTVRNFYRLSVFAGIAGFAWLAVAAKASEQVSVCLIRNVTGLPCPSCGSTRAVLSVFHGDIWQALLWNPVGVLLTAGLFFLPPWLLYDRISGKKTLWAAFRRAEYIVSRKTVAIPLIVVVLCNWVWNILKYT